MRDADEVAAWIHDQMVIASSEDYGKDVEHVEVSLQLLLYPIIYFEIQKNFAFVKCHELFLTKRVNN